MALRGLRARHSINYNEKVSHVDNAPAWLNRRKSAADAEVKENKVPMVKKNTAEQPLAAPKVKLRKASGEQARADAQPPKKKSRKTSGEQEPAAKQPEETSKPSIDEKPIKVSEELAPAEKRSSDAVVDEKKAKKANSEVAPAEKKSEGNSKVGVDENTSNFLKLQVKPPFLKPAF